MDGGVLSQVCEEDVRVLGNHPVLKEVIAPEAVCWRRFLIHLKKKKKEQQNKNKIKIK